MVEKKVYDELKEKYGEVSSWAIWAPVGDKAKSNIGDMTVFDNSNLLETLHTDFIFVALNEGDHGEREDGYTGSWANFHSPYSAGYDYKLRFVLKDTRFWGSYMADIIKHHNDPNSADVIKLVDTTEGLLEKNIEEFKNELKIIGGDPTLVALGGAAKKWLDDHFAGEYPILLMQHFSNWGGQETYLTKFNEFLKENNLEK